MPCNYNKQFYIFFIFLTVCQLSLAKVLEEEAEYVDYFSKGKKKVTPNINYGQLFIEESRRSKPTVVEISALAGSGIGNVNRISWFYGGELRYKIFSSFYMGVEFIKYQSQLPNSVRSVLPDLALEGTKVEVPALRNWAVHFNGHLNFFTSHVNLAGVARINMSIPVQLGIGFTHIRQINAKYTGAEHIDIKNQKVIPSFQWGVGPRVQFGRYVAIQGLFSQVHSLVKPQFILHQVYGNVIFGF